jgi:hypothetical protein
MEPQKSGLAKYPGWLPFAIAGVFFVVVMAMIAFSPQKYIYDEVYYHQYATDLAEKGMGLKYLRELIAPPGPLHGMAHYALGWATGFRPIPMRVVTNGFCLAAGVCAGLLLLRVGRREAFYCAALLYAIPFGGVVLGVSLTESSAMLAATIATLVVVMGAQALDDGSRESGAQSGAEWVGYALVGLAGFLYAAAIWGRQNYLVVLPALPILFFFARGFAWRPLLIVTLVAGTGAGLLFGIWGGLVPEAVRFVSAGRGDASGVVAGLNIIFGIRSLSYAAIAFGILAPGVLRLDFRLLCVCGVGALIGCVFFEPMRFLPSAYLISKNLGEVFLFPASIVFGAGFAFLGFWLFVSVVWNCWEFIKPPVLGIHEKTVGLASRLGRIGWNEKLYLFGTFAWLLILASNMKISHQLSSRYVIVAAPFMLITAVFHFRQSVAAIIRLICGFIVSMFLLANYYEWFR